MEIDIVERKKNFIWYLLLFFYLSPILFVFINLKIGFFLFICGIILHFFYNKLHYEVGTITFLTKSFIVKRINEVTKEILISDIEQFTFEYFDYDRWRNRWGYFFKSSGINNEIYYRYQGVEHKFLIYLQNKDQYNKLRDIINDWMKINRKVVIIDSSVK